MKVIWLDVAENNKKIWKVYPKKFDNYEGPLK